MSPPRAADDFEAIRARIEELRRANPAAPIRDGGGAGHPGPCACGMSLFPDACDGSCKAHDLAV